MKGKDDLELLMYDNKLMWCIFLIILSSLLSFLPVLVLKDGGSWTFFSLLPLWLITYFFGFRTGFFMSLLFSLIKLLITYITESGMLLTPKTFLLEYIIACTCFCLGGIVISSNRKCERYVKSVAKARGKKAVRDGRADSGHPKLPTQIVGDIDKENSSSGLILGYLCGVLIMFVCYILAAPEYDSYPSNVVAPLERLIYDIKYDGSYLLAEAATTVLVLAIPKVRSVIFTCKHIANNEKEDPSICSF
ncbi:MAG: energy-coupled thiamine transporter ThiT [Lachnospiraceae bacterium]|nr:energy-coupled thiamine transporter ThiT [Lachnospiraceae bacterium]